MNDSRPKDRNRKMHERSELNLNQLLRLSINIRIFLDNLLEGAIDPVDPSSLRSPCY